MTTHLDKDTTEYVYRHYLYLLPPADIKLVMHAMHEPKLSYETIVQLFEEQEWPADLIQILKSNTVQYKLFNDPHVKEVIALKIIRDHKDEIFFNHCPTCGQLARTPSARQCRSGHRWTNTGRTSA